MKTRERDFLKASAMAGVAIFPWRRAFPFDQSPTVPGVPLFDATLPGLGPGGANNYGNYLPVLSPRTNPMFPGADYYEIVAKQFTQQVHPSIPATTFFGFADATTLDSRYLGGVIVAKRGRPVKLKVTNLLPPKNILPADPTIIDSSMAAAIGGRTDRAVVHLHGGFVFWDSDGGPFSWFSNANNAPGLVHGPNFINADGPGSALHSYPNDQSARLVWYHDHAYGLTRTNVYAGLVSAYLISDDAETQLINSGVLPDIPNYPLGIPLVIQDKLFWDGGGNDPGYAGVVAAGASAGSLWYPHIYEGPPLAAMTLPPICSSGTGRWENPGIATPPVSTVPEFFADTILVNGAPYPTLPVAPRRFRFRILNGSQARFYNLQLYVHDGTADGITLAPHGTDIDPNGNPVLAPTNAPGPAFVQFGSEGGFLPAPALFWNGSNHNSNNIIGFKATVNPVDPTNGNVNRYNLLLAPAERADIIIDFRGFEGQKLVLYSDAPAPFPGADIRNDYYGNDYDLSCIGGAPSTIPGFGPNTRILMQFEVGSSGHVTEWSFAQTVAALKSALPITFLATQPTTFIKPNEGPRVKTLNEVYDSYGRLIQYLGAPGSTECLAYPTEIANRGEIQRWQIYDLTGDTHPIHFHLVNVAVRKREAWQFDPTTGLPLNGDLAPIPGTARPPDPNEQGWKETVRVNPGEVVTVDMKFDLPSGTPPPPSPRLQASYGIKGADYVWHCHILEHEEHDMMHALVVI